MTAQAREVEKAIGELIGMVQRAGVLDVSLTVGADLVILACRRFYGWRAEER
jgi:hypothetical protein